MTPPGYVLDPAIFANTSHGSWRGTRYSAELEVVRSLGIIVGGTLSFQMNVLTPIIPDKPGLNGKVVPFCLIDLKMVVPPTSLKKLVNGLIFARTAVSLLLYLLGTAFAVIGLNKMDPRIKAFILRRQHFPPLHPVPKLPELLHVWPIYHPV